MLNIISIFLTAYIITFGHSYAYSLEPIVNSDLSAGFELSNTEKNEVEKFLKSINSSGNLEISKIMDAALEGNEVAMYIMGQCSLSGTGTTINRKAAIRQFISSASLGYSPALFEISQYYANEKQDPLLALVYLNLTISFGHKEYRDFYFQQTDCLAKVAGKSVVDEIEKIALQKIIKIAEFQSSLKNFKKYKPAIKLITNNITTEDLFYNEQYWKSFFGSESAYNQFFKTYD